jgi:hypothetical protein
MFKVGDKVRWRFTPPGGYGFTALCDAVVVGLGKRRVQIRVDDHHASPARVRRDGEDRTWVSPEKLILRML